MIRQFAKPFNAPPGTKGKKDKKKQPGATPIAPVEYDNEDRGDYTTQTPLTSLPATFVPAPGGYQGRVASFVTKKAQYSSEMQAEWVPILEDMPEMGRMVDMPNDLPSLWQELLVTAYNEGGDELVEIVTEKYPNLTFVNTIQHKDDPRVRLNGSWDDQSGMLTLYMNRAAIKKMREGDLALQEYVNGIVMHEYKHMMDEYTKTKEEKKEQEKERSYRSMDIAHTRQDYIDMGRMDEYQKTLGDTWEEQSYTTLASELSAIAAEIQLVVQQMKEQGYDKESAVQKATDRFFQFRRYKEDQTQRDIISRLAVEAYDNDEISPGSIVKEKTLLQRLIERFTRRKGSSQLRAVCAAEKVTVGIDIDGVIADFNLLLREIASQYIPVVDEDDSAYKISELKHGNVEVQSKVMEEVYEDHRIPDAPTVKGAVEKINEIYDKGYKVIILTARQDHWYDQTEEWLQKIGLKYHKLIHDKKKGARAVKEGIDIFIDDKPENVRDLIEHGVNAYIFDRPWNEGEDVPRIHGWKNVKAALEDEYQSLLEDRNPEQYAYSGSDRLWLWMGVPVNGSIQEAAQKMPNHPVAVTPFESGKQVFFGFWSTPYGLVYKGSPEYHFPFDTQGHWDPEEGYQLPDAGASTTYIKNNEEGWLNPQQSELVGVVFSTLGEEVPQDAVKEVVLGSKNARRIFGEAHSMGLQSFIVDDANQIVEVLPQDLPRIHGWRNVKAFVKQAAEYQSGDIWSRNEFFNELREWLTKEYEEQGFPRLLTDSDISKWAQKKWEEWQDYVLAYHPSNEIWVEMIHNENHPLAIAEAYYGMMQRKDPTPLMHEWLDVVTGHTQERAGVEYMDDIPSDVAQEVMGELPKLWEKFYNDLVRDTPEWMGTAYEMKESAIEEAKGMILETSQPPSTEDLDQMFKFERLKSFTKFAAPRWTTDEKNRLKELYLKYRARGVPHHIIYKATSQLLGKSFLAVKQKLENMYEIDEELGSMKYEHWDQGKIDQTIRDLYMGGQSISRMSLPANLMYQITNHSLPKAETCGFPAYYDSFDHAMASNILAVGFEREGDKLTESAIETIEDALKYYRRREKMAHAWDRSEIVALFQDAHVAGLPLTYSFFKSHPDIYKPLIGVGRSLEGLRDSIKRCGHDWADLVIEAAPEYVDFYTEDGRLQPSTEELRIRRFLELNEIPFRVAGIADKMAIEDPDLLEQGYKNFVPDFFILDSEGNTQAIVEVFGSVADSAAANTSELYREKKLAKEKFYGSQPFSFIAINNNADGVDLTDEILRDKFSAFMRL